jgi:16S rRNA (uracil1498-N3)-methyltransferase
VKQFILTKEPDGNRQIRLEGGDYRYLARVRRLAPGEFFPALLPNGGEVMLRVCSVDNQALTGEIVSGECAADVRDALKVPPIILFQSLPKGEKMDLIVRQAAEGAVAEIVPFASEFSTVRDGKMGRQKFSRWERIIKEARQQSGSAVATTIRQPLSMDGLFDYWEQIQTQCVQSAVGLLFHHVPLAQESLHRYLDSSPQIVVLVIGPEGGFSPAEAERFLTVGFKPFTIGGTILRTETAALYAQAAVRILLVEKDWWETK